jgi:GTP-binding protein
MNLKLEFIASAYNMSQIPKIRLPEIVICGRSNVGKSSLLNTISGRKNVAKVSSTPGKTESVNYFLCENKFYLVDLPGYGFANRDKKTLESWGKLIQTYFKESGYIKTALHLLDGRHPAQQSDIDLEVFFSHLGLSSFLVLTKSDKLKQSEKAASLKLIKATYAAAAENEAFQFFSSQDGEGKDQLVKRILRLAEK